MGLCQSIKDLYDIEPNLENLDKLSLVNHRIGVLKSFQNSTDEEGYTQAKIRGLTNTLRFRHMKPIANLPSKYKFYGEQIRGAIIPPSSQHILCGSDMSSLEDTTKQHYMYFFDPEYVKEMRIPGFDPHLDIAILAEMLTKEQVGQHKLYSKTEGLEGTDYSEIRGKAKVINFSGVYGAGPPKIAQTLGCDIEFARKLHKIYWERNKAVKQVAKAVKIKEIDGQMWLLNPVSNFWYSLREKKDIFSTLNQGTGVYIFDLYVRKVRGKGIKIMFQYHDEIEFFLLRGEEPSIIEKLNLAIKEVNEEVKLNVPLSISIDFGISYAETH